MKILSFDSVGGASGNMILGALIDLGAPQETLLKALHGLAIEPTEITIEPKAELGQHGTLVTVHHDEHDGHHHDHDHHDHDHHDDHHHDDHHHGEHDHHDHDHADHNHEDHHLPHRTLADVTTIIENAPIDKATKLLSLAVFQRLAEAEGRVHGEPADKIHFHEVGAIDAIIDIVGCCLALNLLKVGGVRVGPLPIGTGTIHCAHGVMPVPVPATVELLKGHVLVQTQEPTELITPTGAALLSTWLEKLALPENAPPSRLIGAGNGFGHKKLHTRANYIRASLYDESDTHKDPSDASENCIILECNLDDMTPEAVGALTEQLLSAGSLDVFVTPIQMKKQRPGVLLSVLCSPDQKPALQDLIFSESTTFGIREHRVKRSILDRRHETVDTPYGAIRMKIGSRNGKDLTASPEFEDCLACAREHVVPLHDVFTAARKAWK